MSEPDRSVGAWKRASRIPGGGIIGRDFRIGCGECGAQIRRGSAQDTTESEASVFFRFRRIEGWRSGTPGPGTFDRSFFDRPAESVALDLLGARLVSTVDGRRAMGAIVEVEAYTGPGDPASHAAARIGRTGRNATMFGSAGTAYVYLSYGLHWCLNVVTGPIGDPCAVLLRAVDPIEGLGIMAARRGRKQDLASGPGRVGQAFGVTDALDMHDFSSAPLRLLPGWSIRPGSVDVSPRVGVSAAQDWPLRFFVRGNTSVSRSRRSIAARGVPLGCAGVVA